MAIGRWAVVVGFLMLLSVGSAGAADSASLRMGAGYAKDADAAKAFRQALAAAKATLGEGQPAFVLFAQSHLDQKAAEALLPVISQELGAVPYLGVGLVSESYEPLTDKGHGVGGFAVMAFGPGFNARVFLADAAPQQEGWLYGTGKEARAQQAAYAKVLADTAQRLAAQMDQADPKSLILVEGPLHQQANYYFMKAFLPTVKKFPNILAGASGDAGAYLIYDGKVQPRKVAAIALSGPFEVMQIGMERLASGLRPSYDRLLGDSAAALGKVRPIGAIMYNCASWQCRSNELDQALAAHLPNVPLYGHCSGGETGRRWLGDTVVTRANLSMVGFVVPEGSAGKVGKQAPQYPPKMTRITGEVAAETPAASQATTRRSVTSQAGFITDWLMLGPYPWSLAQAAKPDGQDMLDKLFVPNEAALTPAPGAQVGDKKWTVYVTDVPEARGGRINLGMAFGYPNFSVAYMGAKVFCDEPMKVRLCCGSDDYAIVWVNGQPVVRYDDLPRGAEWDQHQVTVELRKGENTIVVKVVDVLYGWEALVRLMDLQGRPLKLQSIPWPQ